MELPYIHYMITRLKMDCAQSSSSKMTQKRKNNLLTLVEKVRNNLLTLVEKIDDFAARCLRDLSFERFTHESYRS